MAWTNSFLLAVLGLALAVATVRSVPRRRWIILLLLDVPLLVLLVRWASFRQAWLELVTGLVGSAAAFGLWWLLHGRRLGPPRDDNIRVVTQDDPPDR
jgi:hypothetical protein